MRSIWHRFRVLDDADVAHLRAQIADPAATWRAIAVCLELIYAHGLGTTAEVDALAPRWRSTLAKDHPTRSTEWRHPMVTLTCLARDLGHPLTARLETWWDRPAPKWKAPLRPLTWLGAPNEENAARLWEHAATSHDGGYLMTWFLMRARLDGTPPLHALAALPGAHRMPDHVLHRAIIGVADPAQPLWNHEIDARSPSWWHRAVAVARDPDVPGPLRVIVRTAARMIALRHHLVNDPDQVSPTPAPAEIAAAVRWAREPLFWSASAP